MNITWLGMFKVGILSLITVGQQIVDLFSLLFNTIYNFLFVA